MYFKIKGLQCMPLIIHTLCPPLQYRDLQLKQCDSLLYVWICWILQMPPGQSQDLNIMIMYLRIQLHKQNYIGVRGMSHSFRNISRFYLGLFYMKTYVSWIRKLKKYGEFINCEGLHLKFMFWDANPYKLTTLPYFSVLRSIPHII